MFSVELIDTFEGFVKLADVWNDTVIRSDTDFPFLTHQWFSCCLQACQQFSGLMVLLVRQQGEVVGIAPLVRRKGKLGTIPVRLVSLIGGDHRFKNSFILTKQDPGILEAVYNAVREACRYDMFNLNMIPRSSHMHASVSAFSAGHGIRCYETADDISPFIRIEHSWDDYLKTRSGRLRQKMNYVSRLFRRAGHHEIVEYRCDSLDDAIRDLEQVSHRSWKFNAGSAIISKPDNRRFFHFLTRTAAAQGWLRLWMLKIEGQPAAFAYNLEYKGRTYALKIEFDEHYRHFSPSEFLYTHAIKDSFERGLKEYDWLGTVQPYKMKWTSLSRPHSRILLFNDALYGDLLYYWKTSFVEPVQRYFAGKNARQEGVTDRQKALGRLQHRDLTVRQ
jgi:CelD/BcsL family acetyltransferase involved in cellulose biosynthesis